jgi:hypothetical protein
VPHVKKVYVLDCLSAREYLWKFFFPSSYEPIEVTKLPEAGQKRVWRSFDFKLSMQERTSIDILFTKNKVTFVSILCTQFISLVKYHE